MVLYRYIPSKEQEDYIIETEKYTVSKSMLKTQQSPSSLEKTLKAFILICFFPLLAFFVGNVPFDIDNR
jgi:hypothetical protein